ncbi:MAG TPA: ester cyclase [Nitrospirota bacterium]|nr:ester cyclase [Nitrospirota bacterium]
MKTGFRFHIVALALALLFHPGPAGASPRMENKEIVLAFYEDAINRKDFGKASKYLGSRYIQHNQDAADGAEGLRNFISFLKDKYPKSHSEIKRVFIDGNFVILHVHAVRVPGTPGFAIVDIFRLKNGKIVEHWDVHEAIIDKPANQNGMF